MMIWIVYCCIALGLFIVSIFAASEGTLAASNRVRLRHIIRQTADDENSETQYLSTELSNDDQRFIAGVTIAANIPLFLTAALIAWLLAQHYSWNWQIALIGILPALVVAALFQIAPRLMLVHLKEGERMWWIKPARWIFQVLRPLVYVLQWLANLPLRSENRQEITTKRNEDSEDDEVQTAELRELMEAAKESGVIGYHGGRLIESIFDFGDTRIQEVMVPRTEIAALPIVSSCRQVAEMMERTGYSRIPLYEENLDHIAGVIHAKDVLKMLQEDATALLQDYMRPPVFLPETLNINQALSSMRGGRDHVALAIDEFGGTAGLVTIEDILEELVGEITDEHDQPAETLFLPLNDAVAVIDGKLHIDELEEAWGLRLPDGDYDTVSGFIMDQLGRPPHMGDRVEIPAATLVVLSMRGYRPQKIRIIRQLEDEDKVE